MSWTDIVIDTAEPGESLVGRVDELLAEQRATWRAFSSGEASLADLRQTTVTCEGARVVVQANPGRRASVHAPVDPASVAARPCFLCPESIPPAEKGIAFADLVLLPNPFPIVRRHLTVPSRAHRPQRLAGRVRDLLALAWALGPDLLVFYNGPRCGASAPDHFHFQAGSAAGVPLVEEYSAAQREVTPVSSFGRRFLLIRGDDQERVAELVNSALAALPADGGQEPMLNAIAVFSENTHSVFLFPRAKHRPACYSAEEPAKLSVSPGSLEMMGILVVADAGHVDRVDAPAARAIFEEVCVDETRLLALAETIG